jgi:glycerol-3-phosphate O-acyltransferase
MATAAGVTQAVFPEGGLSRDGRLRPPKLGLLDYMVRSFDPTGERDIAFVPVGINYDRTFEDRAFLSELDPAAPKTSASGAARSALRFVLRNLWLMARNRWHRFGYACVNVGSPISLKDYMSRRGADFRALSRDDRFARVEDLAKFLMDEIARVIPAVPVSLVATVFLRHPARAWSELELKGEVLALMRRLDADGAHVYVPRQDQDYAITVGLRMLTLRRLVTGSNGLYSAEPRELPLLSYYANSIAHLVAPGRRESGAV